MTVEEESAPLEPEWSLITVTYNSEHAFEHHWRDPVPAGVEWIVVDNDSSDRSVEIARGRGAIVVPLPSNLGFGAANNVGFSRAQGRFVAFVNPDVTVDFAELEKISASLSSRGGLVAPQLVLPDGELQPNGRGAPSLTNKVLSRLGSQRVRDDYYRFPVGVEELEVDWLMGAVVAGKRDDLAALRDAGPWDPRFFVYYEDADIGLRAWTVGQSVRVLGNCRWVHGWARATKSFNKQAWKLEIDSMLKFYSRYPSLVFSNGRGAWPSARNRQKSHEEVRLAGDSQ